MKMNGREVRAKREDALYSIVQEAIRELRESRHDFLGCIHATLNRAKFEWKRPNAKNRFAGGGSISLKQQVAQRRLVPLYYLYGRVEVSLREWG